MVEIVTAIITLISNVHTTEGAHERRFSRGVCGIGLETQEPKGSTGATRTKVENANLNFSSGHPIGCLMMGMSCLQSSVIELSTANNVTEG